MRMHFGPLVQYYLTQTNENFESAQDGPHNGDLSIKLLQLIINWAVSWRIQSVVPRTKLFLSTG
jgi:hypothetical protein